MKISMVLFVLAELAVAIFILMTSGALPDRVASHFNAAGIPDGYMPKQIYIYFILAFGLGIPAIVACSMAGIDRFPEKYINLPNKRIWLSAKHRESTFVFIRMHSIVMAVMTAMFLAYVHWLVIKANAVVPAQLSSSAIIGGLVIFVVALLGWGLVLPIKFKRLPNP